MRACRRGEKSYRVARNSRSERCSYGYQILIQRVLSAAGRGSSNKAEIDLVERLKAAHAVSSLKSTTKFSVPVFCTIAMHSVILDGLSRHRNSL